MSRKSRIFYETEREFPAPARTPAGTGYRCYLPRFTAPRDSELLLAPEPLLPEDDEADEDDLPADDDEGPDAVLAADRALVEELELPRAIELEPELRGEELELPRVIVLEPEVLGEEERGDELRVV